MKRVYETFAPGTGGVRAEIGDSESRVGIQLWDSGWYMLEEYQAKELITMIQEALSALQNRCYECGNITL